MNSALEWKIVPMMVGSASDRLIRSTLTLILWLLPLCTQADDLVLVHEQVNEIEVHSLAKYYEDETASKSFDQLRKPPLSEQFAYLEEKTLSKGFSQSAFWVRFDIRYSRQNLASPNSRRFFLELGHPLIARIDMFIEREGNSIDSYHTGNEIPRVERSLPYPELILPLELFAEQTTRVYLRVESKSTLVLPIHMFDETAFVSKSTTEHVVNGLYYGAILAFAGYNLFLFLSFRDRSYVLYVLYLLSIASYLAMNDGLLHYVANPHWPIFSSAELISANLAIAFALEFTRSFLKLSYNLKIFNWLAIIGITSLVSLTLAIPLLNYATSAYLTSYVILFSMFVIYGSALRCWLLGFRIARFFLIAWSLFIAGVVLNVLLLLDVIPINFLSMYSIKIGSLLEALFLSFALADRINQMQLEKQQLQKEVVKTLQESNRTKDEFLATISHELRTPMNGVEGSLELIRQEQPSSKIIGHLDTAERSAESMTELIENILDFSEAQSGRIRLHESQFQLSESLVPFLQLNERLCEEKGLKFRYTLDSSLNDSLSGDVQQFLRVLNHLLDNAIKFTQKGSIDVSITSCQLPNQMQDQAGLEVIIRDTGIGIPQDQINNIFNAFQQVDGTLSRQYGGLGIGLALCKQIIQLMGGCIQVSSEEGKGSRFAVRIPFKVSPNAEQRNTSPMGPQRDGQRHFNAQVLVVEDNPVNLKVLKSLLEKRGLCVATAMNGEEGLRQAQAQAFALIFMDLQMPVMDGLACTRAIRKQPGPNQSTPVIAVTANALSSDQDRCFEAGMDDYMKKPVKKQVLDPVLQRFLDEQNKDREVG